MVCHSDVSLMKAHFVDLLCCPETRQRLRLEASEHGASSIQSGWLVSDDGRKRYEIRNGIPRFVPQDNYAQSFGFQWNTHARTQLDSYTGVSVSRDRLFGVTGWQQDLTGQRILEAGSGAGRFTEILGGTGAEIYSFDYSSAVDANASNNGSNGRINFFQASIFDIPFPDETFDKVLCLGVIQHTPDPEGAFRSLAKQVRPGGELAVDVYARRLSALLHWRFVLRPITRRMDRKVLYKVVRAVTPALLPVAVALRKLCGNAGARLVPVAEFSYLPLTPSLHRDWSILDTFDWYSPQYDFPQTLSTVSQWFAKAGFVDVVVEYGPNGIVARGRKPARHDSATRSCESA
jgi:2-polyprenyl-3-methyl-5-hydroxy-6-metoxy-1,4-benzoquinol methylase